MTHRIWRRWLNRLSGPFSGKKARRSKGSSFPIQMELLEVRSLLTVSFQPAATYAAGTYPTYSAVGDFNGDSKSDLAVANYLSHNVTILLGNGDGTFQAGVSCPVTNPFKVTVGDLNGDGKSDLAVANTYDFSTTISVFLGNGDGSFQSAVNSSTALTPYVAALGDFNADSNLDFAVANGADENGGNNVSILLGNGDGSFQSPVHYASGGSTSSLVTGDFNSDGKVDLAVANSSANFSGPVNTVGILFGNGDGTFQNAVIYASGGSTSAVAAGDFNSDGTTDLAVSHPLQNAVGILLGNSDGTFQTAVNYAAGSFCASLCLADFNGDGKTDVVTGNQQGNDVSILLGNGDGTLQTPINFAVANVYSVAVGDLNADGKVDLVVPDYVNNVVNVLLNNSVFALTPQQQITLIIDQVNDLLSTNVLSKGNGNALLVKLNHALSSLNAGNKTAAINQLKAFINQINSFKKSGRLMNSQSELLIDAANHAIESA